MDSQCLLVGHRPGALQRHLGLDAVQAAALQLTLLGQFPVGTVLITKDILEVINVRGTCSHVSRY